MRQKKRVLAAVLSFLMLFGTDNQMDLLASEIAGENLGSPMQSVEEASTEVQETDEALEDARIQESKKAAEETELQEDKETQKNEQTSEKDRTAEAVEVPESSQTTEAVQTVEGMEATETPGAADVPEAAEEPETTEATETADVADLSGVQQELKVSYLVMQKTFVQTPDSQFVLLGYEQTGAKPDSMTLQYRNRETGELYEVQAGELFKDAALFFMDFQTEQMQGIYDLTGIAYTTAASEAVQTIAFSDTGITAAFGINEEVTNTPDAVITEAAQEQPDVVMTDAAGNTISQEGFAEALGNASADVAADTVDATGGSKKIVVVLDPGHGGQDGGASYYGRLEKNLNLSIASYCKAELETYGGVTVYMTRTGDNYVGLTDRAQIAANYGADIFVSIHNNACGNPAVGGASVYYPNANYRPDLGSNGKGLAAQIEDHLVRLGLANRGILVRNCVDNTRAYIYPDGTHADYYHVIRECKLRGIAGLIVEHAYMTSYSDMANHLASEPQLQQLGIADATAIAEYYGLRKGTDKITLESVSSGSSTSLKLCWQENNYLDGYVIYRSTEKNGTYKRIKEIRDYAATTYTDKGLTSGKKYYYRIVGKKGTTELGKSGVKSGYALMQPKLTAVKAAGSKILQVSWKKVGGATGYEIYRSNSLNGTYKRVKKITNAATLSWKDKTVKTGKKYYYRILAYQKQKKATGYSSNSKKVYGSTIAATKLTSVTSTQSGHALIKWKKVTGAKRYQIYRSEKKNGKYHKLASTKNGKTVSYSDKSGKAGKTYYYKVRVMNYVNRTEGYSDDSKPVSGRQLIRPVWKSVVSKDSSGITLSWKKVSGATEYRIYRSTTKNGSYKKLKTLKGSGVVKYTDKTAKSDQIYYYRLQAAGRCGVSALSEKHWCRILNTPVLITVLPQESGIMRLSWNKTAHAGGYIIYRRKGTDTVWSKVKTIEGASVTTWQDPDTKEQFTYTYQIQAYAVRNKGKADQQTDYSDRSNVLAAKHLEIPLLQLTEAENHQVQLSWKKTVDADRYQIIRTENASGTQVTLNTEAFIYDAAADSYTCVDASTEAGHSYTYSIRAEKTQDGQTASSDPGTQAITLQETVIEE